MIKVTSQWTKVEFLTVVIIAQWNVKMLINYEKIVPLNYRMNTQQAQFANKDAKGMWTEG
jgi:hypothetical protein